MTVEEFLVDFQDVLQSDDPIVVDATLEQMEEWDSLAIMACMAYLDRNFGVRTKFAQYDGVKTVRDIIALAGNAIQ